MENSNDNRKKYYKKFYELHKNRIREKTICQFCGGSYDYFNKSQHMKSLKCIKAKDGEEAYKQAKINKILKK